MTPGAVVPRGAESVCNACSDRQVPPCAKEADFPYSALKIRPIRNNRQDRHRMTERIVMNGCDFAREIGRMARAPAIRRAALPAILAALTLVAIGLDWFVGSPRRDASSSQARTPQITHSDSPSWGRARPTWPRYLGHWTAASTTARTATAEVIRGPSEPASAPQTAIGPDLLVPTGQSTALATTQLQAFAPLAGGAPARPIASPQFPAAQPTGALPAPPVALNRAPQSVNEPARSEAMEKIATQADQQIRHGYELAGRGGCFAARAEFTAALRLIAQGLDDEHNTTFHSQALSAALTAMKEAQDFIPPAGKLEADLDLPPIVAAHHTPVLKNLPREQLQAMRALKQYMTFAQQQFALAGGQEVCGSVALGALGKLHAALAGKPNPEIVAPAAKAIVFFQAAILVCPRNYMAANDLGVLLAHSGDFVGAVRSLEYSVLLCRCSENLANLSVVYRQVGQQRLADLAAEKGRAAKAEEVARQKNARLSAGGTVAWVDPGALVQSPGQWADSPAKAATAVGQQGPAMPNPASDKPIGLLPAGLAPTSMR
jgi:hypothetical protein